MTDGGKKKALGRGLGALIPQAPPATTAAADRVMPIAEIAPNPWQPRTHFDEAKIDELADSIREKGVLQPLLVRRRGAGYELVAGERRLRAAERAGLDAVPVTVRDLDDRGSLEAALIENLQRDDLSALEEGAGYKALVDEFGLTQEEVARRVGKSRPAVANTLRLLQLPEAVREELRSGRLSAGHARALLALESSAEQTTLARDAVRRGLSVRQLERQIQQRVTGKKRRRPAPDVHVADVESQLARSLGTKVRLLARGQRGRIVIEYYSRDDLERLVTRLREGKRL